MAVRFDLKKFETIKQAYLDYLEKGKCNTDMLQNFAAYKPYLDADEEIRNIQRAIKSQKEAERRRLEEQKQAAKEAAKAAQKAAQEAKAAKKQAKKQKRVTESAGNFNWDAPQPPVRRPRVHLSPIAKKLQDVNTYDDLKFLMNSSFLDTIKKDDDFAVLKSAIIRCTKGHEDDKKLWFKTIEQRKLALQQKISPTHNINYVRPKPVIIYTPQGGQNKRY